ncbi:MAG: branched-chain amino acid ABC transporter permease [Desulfarculus sp.]|nr:MAG: branched-chain amino acid ABC transporter permease [Desulfarculus sp.]
MIEAFVQWFGDVAAIPGLIWLQQSYLGLVNGSVLVLMALGLTIIFGLLGITNFAHGAFYMLGAYVGWSLLRLIGNFWVAMAVVPLVGAMMGLVVERFLLAPTYRKKDADFLGILITFGLGLAAPDLVRWIYGNLGLPYVKPLPDPMFTIGNIPFSQYRFFLIVVAMTLCFCFWWLLQKTNLGMIIRAGTSDSPMVEILGIDVRRVWTLTFSIGVAIASFAGVLVGPILAVQPIMGVEILVQCFIVVIIGGLGSFWGAVVAGFGVGQILTLFPLLPHCSRLGDVVIFALAAMVLLTRPQGLFGQD